MIYEKASYHIFLYLFETTFYPYFYETPSISVPSQNPEVAWFVKRLLIRRQRETSGTILYGIPSNEMQTYR